MCEPNPGFTDSPRAAKWRGLVVLRMVKTVGKYQVGKTLGEGTFGKVKFALNTETEEAVAIKVLDKERIQQQEMGAQVLARHPRTRRRTDTPAAADQEGDPNHEIDSASERRAHD